jgi:hypothetical protein
MVQFMQKLIFILQHGSSDSDIEGANSTRDAHTSQNEEDNQEDQSGPEDEDDEDEDDDLEAQFILFILFQEKGQPIRYQCAAVSAETTLHDIKVQLWQQWHIPVEYQRLMVCKYAFFESFLLDRNNGVAFR